MNDSEPKFKPPVGLIAMMGGTGTGKSSFINAIAGRPLAPVGHGLESVTTEVNQYDYTTAGGLPVTLVDTPGFNDFRDGAGKSDLEILKMISAFLKKQYDDDQKFSGILYFHDIKEPRIGTVMRRNMTMFKKLCGTNSMKNVIVVTTFWDLADPKLAVNNEAEIMTREGFLKELLDGGARFIRSGKFSKGNQPTGDRFPSPQRVVQELLSLDPVFVEMQKELAAGMTVAQTAAGVELNKEFEVLKHRYRKEMADVNARLEGLRVRTDDDKKARLELIEANEKLRGQVQKWEDEQRSMKLKLEDYHANFPQQAGLPSEAGLTNQQQDREILELRNQIQLLTSQNVLLQQSCDQLKTSLSESFSTAKQLGTALDCERKEKNTATSELQDLRNDLQARDVRQRELQQKIHDTHLSKSKMSFELQAIQTEHASTLKELKGVKAALDKATANRDTSQQEKGSLASEADELRSTIGKLRVELKEALRGTVKTQDSTASPDDDFYSAEDVDMDPDMLQEPLDPTEYFGMQRQKDEVANEQNSPKSTGVHPYWQSQKAPFKSSDRGSPVSSGYRSTPESHMLRQMDDVNEQKSPKSTGVHPYWQPQKASYKSLDREPPASSRYQSTPEPHTLRQRIEVDEQKSPNFATVHPYWQPQTTPYNSKGREPPVNSGYKPMSQLRMCVVCEINPCYSKGPITYQTCSQACAAVLKLAQGEAAPVRSLSSGPQVGMCQVCHIRPQCFRNGKLYPTCGLKCASSAPPPAPMGPRMCDYCHVRPSLVIGNKVYPQCGRACRDKARAVG